MVISLVIAPPDAPQASAPSAKQLPTEPKLDWQDELLIERLQDAVACPVWSLINAVAYEIGHPNRSEGRLLRLQLMQRVKRLRKLGLAYTYGRNQVSANRPDPTTRPPILRRPRRSVAGLPLHQVVSAAKPLALTTPPIAQYVHADNGITGSHDAPTSSQQTEHIKSALPPSIVSAAARQLAQLPRYPRRKWSGWIGAKRSYREMKIILPDGRVAYVYGALRGKVVYFCDRERIMEPGRWGVIKSNQVKVLKNPDAVALGRCKAGVIERKSALKALTSRANGLRPCRFGRKRGRRCNTVIHLR
jgi:hypothetical protein